MYLISFSIETVNVDLEMARAAAQEYFKKYPRLSFAPQSLEEFKQHEEYKKLCDKVSKYTKEGDLRSTVQGEYVQSLWTQTGEIIHIVWYKEKFYSLTETQVFKVVRQLDQAYVNNTADNALKAAAQLGIAPVDSSVTPTPGAIFPGILTPKE